MKSHIYLPFLLEIADIMITQLYRYVLFMVFHPPRTQKMIVQIMIKASHLWVHHCCSRLSTAISTIIIISTRSMIHRASRHHWDCPTIPILILKGKQVCKYPIDMPMVWKGFSTSVEDSYQWPVSFINTSPWPSTVLNQLHSTTTLSICWWTAWDPWLIFRELHDASVKTWTGWCDTLTKLGQPRRGSTLDLSDRLFWLVAGSTLASTLGQVGHKEFSSNQNKSCFGFMLALNIPFWHQMGLARLMIAGFRRFQEGRKYPLRLQCERSVETAHELDSTCSFKRFVTRTICSCCCINTSPFFSNLQRKQVW